MSAEDKGTVVQGRLVWTIGSDLFKGKQKTKYNTNEIEYDKTGQPILEYGFGLAILKKDPATGQPTQAYQDIWAAMHTAAYVVYPDRVIPPAFAMKFIDGDSVNPKTGRPYSEKEGYAGHIIVASTTRIPIRYFIFRGGNNELVNTGFKNGDYVKVQYNIKAHGEPNAGLYMNPLAVQMIQEGKAIVSAPSGDQMSGNTAPTYQGQVVAEQAPMPNAMPGAVAPVAPVAPVAQPHYQVLPETMQPVPGNGIAQPVAPAPIAATPVAPMATPMASGYVAPVAHSEGIPHMP